MALRAGHDWFYPYYRDRALCLTLGRDAATRCCCRRWARRPTRPPAAARCPPTGATRTSTSSARPRPPARSSCRPSGCAEAGRLRDAGVGRDHAGLLRATAPPARASSGKRSTPPACERLPVLFLVEDNGYAISVPVECQTAGGSISQLRGRLPGPAARRRWTAPISWPPTARCSEAVEYCRERQGPGAGARPRHPAVLALALRRRAALQDRGRARRPKPRATRVLNFPQVPDRRGRAGPPRAAAHHARNRPGGPGGHRSRRCARPPPAPETALRPPLLATTVDPASDEFAAEPHFSRRAAHHGGRDQRHAARGDAAQSATSWSSARTWPIAAARRTSSEVKGKGGVFKVTHGLQTEFGSARVFNSPLAEAAIVGRAIGMATRGLKPVVEIQFFDYIWPAMMQIRDELATCAGARTAPSPARW